MDGQFIPIALADMIAQLYGTRSRPVENPLVTQVGVAAVKIMGNNPMRVGFIVVNLSGNAMYMGLDGTVAATKGVFIPPNGGAFHAEWNTDFELCSHEWYAIAAAAASSVYVLENVNG